MPTRSQLIAYWRTRLTASQVESEEGSVHLGWLRRAYARIYRFLLSQYGDASEAGDPPQSETPSSMPLVDNTREHLGRPPKSLGKIQATLKHIHNASGRCDEPGPLVGGAGDMWLVVAARREKWIPSKCANLLRRNGIDARVAARSGDAVVEVERRNLAEATALLQSRRASLRYRGGYVSLATPLVDAMIGSAAGALVGLMLVTFCLYLEQDRTTAGQVFWLFAGCGALAGFVIGCAALLRCHSQSEWRPATTWGSTITGGVFGGFVGMVFGFLFFPSLALMALEIPRSPENMASATLATTVFGLIAGWIIGCWIGFRDFRWRSRTPTCVVSHPDEISQLRADWYPILFGGFCGFWFGALLVVVLNHAGWVHWTPASGRALLLSWMFGAAVFGAGIGGVFGSRSNRRHS